MNEHDDERERERDSNEWLLATDTCGRRLIPHTHTQDHMKNN